MKYNLHNMDCRIGMDYNLPDESIDLVVTSPPYKDEDGYTDKLVEEVFQGLHRVQKQNSLFFLNFGHLANFKNRPFKVLDIASECGYSLNDVIIWVKNHYRPIQGKKRVNNLFEYIFLLYKGKMPDLDRLSVGIPYKDKSNVGRFTDIDLKCAGNVWYINYETIQKTEQKLHNDRFPVELPERCIKLSGIKEESWVLDPFSGSATTGVACQKLGMNYVGFDIDKEHHFSGLTRLEINE